MQSLDLSELSLQELLAHLIEPGEASRLDRPGTLRELARPGFAGRAALMDLTASSRRRLEVAFELGRRRERERVRSHLGVAGPLEVAAMIAPLLRDEPVEVFCAVLLDGRHRFLDLLIVSRGTLTASLVHPREVFRAAVQARAGALIVAHNHPSGDAQPSREDDLVTRRLARAGQILGVPVLDHLVIGEGTPYSYRAMGRGELRGRRTGAVSERPSDLA